MRRVNISSAMPLGWCPRSSSAANRSPEETDICVCSQGMWRYPCPVYKDWAVPSGLLSCPRLSVSFTKRFTPSESFIELVLHTHTPTACFFPLCLSFWICKVCKQIKGVRKNKNNKFMARKNIYQKPIVFILLILQKEKLNFTYSFVLCWIIFHSQYFK